MSKINAVRIVNLNYNNNAIKVSDEIFRMGGDSTLLSLRNGGGKSVLVQMVTAPFVHKKYRNTRVRPFESYFTTNKPTFIMVEWKLDGGAGFVLTGMMVRKRQSAAEEDEAEDEKLEIYNFISEYKESCNYDIYNLPVVEKNQREMVLKGFAACLKLFESYKKDRSCNFQYYDMSNHAQSRSYFKRLLEYQINSREWESIIYEVNKKESGLSELFSDCKDEKGLVEKWFLKAVGDKLNQEKDRMKEFQDLVEKYARQYRENRSKIEKRDTMKAFKEEAAVIEARALDAQRACEEQAQQENAIANFIWVLHRLEREAGLQRNEIQGQVERLNEELWNAQYEKLSFEYYGLKENEQFHISSRDMIGLERDGLEREKERAGYQLHRLYCAGQQAETDEYFGEYEECRQRLEILRKKDEDMEPERRQIGGRLKKHFETMHGDLICRLEKKEQERHSCSRNAEEQETLAESLTDRIAEKQGSIGRIKAKLEAYDDREQEFNRKFHENLSRNLLGEYEPAELDIREKKLACAMEEKEKSCLKQKKELVNQKEAQRHLQRDAEELLQHVNEQMLEKNKIEQQLEKFEQELTERRSILAYFDLTEADLFDREKILEHAGKKLQEAEQARLALEQEIYEQQKEYKRLSQGKVLNLPEEFDAMLKELGLHPVFGMDWLKKNGNSVQENQKLVKQHPFLPYALILSEQEFETLRQHQSRIYTSFPIPILLREQLEGGGESESSLIRLSGVSFYVLFNSNLLDEKKLAELLKEQEQAIQKRQVQLVRRKQEFLEYCDKRNTIQKQDVTRKKYDKKQEGLADADKAIEEGRTNVREIKEEIAKTQQYIQELEKEIGREEEELRTLKEKQSAFKEICRAYQEYVQSREELERLEQDISAYENQRRLARETLAALRSSLASLDNEIVSIQREEENIREKCRVYSTFSTEEGKEDRTGKTVGESNQNLLTQEEWQRLEARFQVLTRQVSEEMQELEKQLHQAGRRLKRAKDKLEQLSSKYGLQKQDWREVIYNKKEELHQEAEYEELTRRVSEKSAQWNEEDKKAVLAQQETSSKLQEILEKCGKDKPAAKEQIRDKDFQAIINQLLFQKGQKEKEEQCCRERIGIYQTGLSALAEYEELEIQRKIHYEEELEEKSAQELRHMQGMLLRDYKNSREQVRECRAALEKIIRDLLMQERFQEDDYKKPLEIMLELPDAGMVLEQLVTITTSYDMLMEKLEIDISLLEREKEHIAALLEEYVQAVHLQLDKIDDHSTITVRERRIKMLILNLPSWEEQEELYRIRVQDFIDEIVTKGLEFYDNNENPTNFISSRLTTRNLYDTIVGIHNVQVRLFKIEEYREYPIDWADVARNSGGEGFLSAFVVLASLLYYMRRDDTDLFADKNEGKVLIMDNPFAQTNAAHLLRPMMDMARQTNTQLICLSGLGGESIYNCFDNIYVLNLVDASLRNGMQYLRSERLRGEEQVVSSHIQVGEQLGLEF